MVSRMEFSVGVDLVEIDRFKRLNYHDNRRFYDRVFTPDEIKQCLSSANPAPHFAANFSAKEAVYKALNKYANLRLDEIEVLRARDGAPYVNLTPGKRKKAKKGRRRQEPAFEIKLSLSHVASHAIAFVVARPLENFGESSAGYGRCP